MKEQKTSTDKPNWLLKLEQESWQAELIISGVAILGSLQLPDLIDRLGEWALIYFSADSSIFCSLFLSFLYFIAGIIPTTIQSFKKGTDAVLEKTLELIKVKK